jgi:hypothetical protein
LLSLNVAIVAINASFFSINARKLPLSENGENPIHCPLQQSSIPAGRLQYSHYQIAVFSLSACNVGLLEVQLFRCLGV